MNRRTRLALQFLWFLVFLLVLCCALAPGRWVAKLAVSGNWQHFGAFACLMFLGGVAFSLTPARLALVLLLLGIGIEIAQAGVPGRAFEWSDWIVDGAGILAGSLVFYSLNQRRAVSVED